MSVVLHFWPANEAEARRLAAALDVRCEPVSLRQFPDGESLVRVGQTGSTALLYCALDRPDAKLVQMLLAASALRDGGADRILLIAPYLGYMRQDQAFAQGEAVSQRVIGGLISSAFDALVTVDPHLHRTTSLEAVVPGIAAVNVSAAATIAQAIAPRVVPGTILVGPDAESRPWVEAVAAPLGLDVMIGEKVRHGDRKVELAFTDISRVAGLPVMLVDDLISSGSTLIACAVQLRVAGATSVAAVATHCLASEADLAALAASGIAPVLATDTVPGPVAAISMATALAEAIRQADLIS
jgi:ribose-phosphate pyrophosphokinase